MRGEALLDRIAARFKAGERLYLDVREWGELEERDADGGVTKPATPLRISYTPVTLENRSTAYQAGGGDPFLMHARLVALKACDEKGERLFDLGDAVDLLKKADPDVISRIAQQMTGRLTVELAEKN